MFVSNSTADSFTIPSINIGNNLVEISALSTLIGSNVAQSLVLGNQGAAGLAWAATSSFGSISVIKACVSGACSSWLRETLGVRTKLSDMAVGMDLELDSTHNVQDKIDAPLAIVCYSGETGAVPARVKVGRTLPKGCQSWSSVHAFDRTTSAMVSGVQETPVGSALRVFTNADYPFFRRHNKPFQISALLFSLAKFGEIHVLWGCGGGLLGLVTALPWAYFLVAATFVEIRELLLGRAPESVIGCLDIIAGRCPTVDQPGGARKVILGATHNPRRSLWWRLVWGMGALLCATSVCLTYFLLGQQPGRTVVIWTCFQILWLLIRIFVYHFADSADPLARRMLVERSPTHLPVYMKERVVNLTFALAKYQIRTHPRGEPAYLEESSSSYELVSMFVRTPPEMLHPLSSGQAALSSLEVEVIAVVGDTMLSSVAWMSGSKLSPMDLYDSCIVLFAVSPTSTATVKSRTLAIPAVRVLSGPVELSRPLDLEMSGGAVPQFVPKGSSNLGYGLVWWYWIPCESGMWLQIRSGEGMKIVGKREADVLTDAQVTSRLAAGTLNISLSHVDSIKETVEMSRRGSHSLVEFITSMS